MSPSPCQLQTQGPGNYKFKSLGRHCVETGKARKKRRRKGGLQKSREICILHYANSIFPSAPFSGHAVRNIELSRGSREGNNALIKDVSRLNARNACSDAHLRDCASKALAQSDATWEECKKFAAVIGGVDSLGKIMMVWS